MALWMIAAGIAFYIKGLCGFANTLVFTSILGFAVDNAAITPVDVTLCYPTNLYIAWRNRKALDRRIYLPLCVLVLLGSVPGAFLLKNVNAQAIKVLFGFVVILLGVEMLLRESDRIHFRESKLLLTLIGVLSGVLSGLFGIGALLAVYVGKTTRSNAAFQANMNVVFAVEGTFRIILYAATGIITLSTLKQAALLLPFILLGLFSGIRSGRVLNERTVKRLVILLLILSGILMILKNLL